MFLQLIVCLLLGDCFIVHLFLFFDRCPRRHWSLCLFLFGRYCTFVRLYVCVRLSLFVDRCPLRHRPFCLQLIIHQDQSVLPFLKDKRSMICENLFVNFSHLLPGVLQFSRLRTLWLGCHMFEGYLLDISFVCLFDVLLLTLNQ